MPAPITVHALTHHGAQRPDNEDAIAVDDWICTNDLVKPKRIAREVDKPFAALVADGMGGHAAGGFASRTVVEHIVRHADGIATPGDAERVVSEANRILYDMIARQEGAPGMGTTVVGAAVRGDGVVVFNVGDSRAYRFDAIEGLVQVSTDDTPGPKLDNGRTAAITTPMITQSLGGQLVHTPVEPHTEAEKYVAGRRYLLCSDGLSDMVRAARIEQRLREGDAAAVEGLFRDAMDAGGSDNISIVLIRLGG